MGPTTLRVATRGSRLAQAQTEEALAALRPILPPDTSFQILTLQTPGDRDGVTPLGDPSVPDDFFTRDIDEALLQRTADIAVHSAKDLPQSMRDGLAVAALLPALDIRDALVLRPGLTSEDGLRRIGSSSPRREQEIRKLFPDAEPLPLRGTIDQRLDKLDRGAFDAIVVAACALQRLNLADRIHRFLDYDPAPQQGRLAIVVRSDDQALLDIISCLDVRRKAGLVAIVGCPADEALISVRAQQYLKQADVVLHDRLIPDSVLLAIRSKSVSVGKAGGHPSISQAEINRRTLAEAEAGKLVVRLHGGDPGIYGHLGEELEFLTSWNIRVDIVPALTAAQLAAAQARAPLTLRGGRHRITLISGHPSPGHPIGPLPGPDLGQLAVYMAVSDIAKLLDEFKAAGWPPTAPVIVGERLGYRDARVRSTDLDHLPELEIDTPAVFLVGVKAIPTVHATLFVGTDPEHFLRHGPLIHWPLIKLISRPLRERVAHLNRYLSSMDGVLFPSRFAVHSFVEAIMQGQDVRALAGKLLLAVGPSTEEELARYGLRADGAADNLGGIQSLAPALGKRFEGKYLYPCSDAAPQEERMALLREHGVELQPCVFYTNREMPAKDLPRLPFSRVLFTSTSTVKVYFNHYPLEREARRTWLAVGPSTRRALEALNLKAEILE